MTVVQVELNQTKRKLMTKVLLTSALYAQLAHSKESRELFHEIALVDLARAIGLPDHEPLHIVASKFDDMLSDLDWTLNLKKKDGALSWKFCNCGKEDCGGHDL